MTKATRLARALARDEQDDAPQAQPSPWMEQVELEKLAWRGQRFDDLLRVLRTLATREDGWLRLIPDTLRQEVHLKWKFTRGDYPNHYVYVRIEDMRVHEGLEVLLRKLYEVDTNVRRPTPDKPYHSEEGR